MQGGAAPRAALGLEGGLGQSESFFHCPESLWAGPEIGGPSMEERGGRAPSLDAVSRLGMGHRRSRLRLGGAMDTISHGVLDPLFRDPPRLTRGQPPRIRAPRGPRLVVRGTSRSSRSNPEVRANSSRSRSASLESPTSPSAKPNPPRPPKSTTPSSPLSCGVPTGPFFAEGESNNSRRSAFAVFSAA